MPAATPKAPIDTTQPDTEDMASEIKALRNLKYPIDITKRIQNINTLKAFAVEWEIKMPEIKAEDYLVSAEIFETTKGRILKEMRKELHKLSERDAKNLKEIFSTGIQFFEEEEKK